MSFNQFSGGGDDDERTTRSLDPLPGTTADGCSPTARVRIDGIEVPWVGGTDGGGGLEVQMRKTGSADLTRTATVHVPYEWRGRDIISTIGGFDGLGGATARIDVLDEVTGEYGTVQHGPIVTVGPSGSVTGCFQFRVDDWANVLERVSADASFVDRFTVEDVLDYVSSRALTHDLIDALPIQTRDALADEEYGEDEQGPLVDAARGILGPAWWAENPSTNKSFTPNRHDLTDVLDWLASITNGYWWVDYAPRTDGPTLVFTDTPTRPSIDALPLDEDASEGDVRLLSNNALFQIAPQHTLTVNGKTSLSQTDTSEVDTPLGDATVIENSQVYPSVTVQHERLAERAVSSESPPEVEAETTSLAETEAIAKKRLKSMIDTAAGGQMTIIPSPVVRPYGIVEAVPACGSSAPDLDPITYEIEEVIHDISPPTTRTDAGHTTILRCATTATDDELTIVEARMVEI